MPLNPSDFGFSIAGQTGDLTQPDFTFHNHGNIWVIKPITEAAKAHAAEVYADAQWFGGGVVVEPRYVDLNVGLLEDDGFTCQ